MGSHSDLPVMQAAADFIRQRGRIAIGELAAKSSQFVDLEARQVAGAATPQRPLLAAPPRASQAPPPPRRLPQAALQGQQSQQQLLQQRQRLPQHWLGQQLPLPLLPMPPPLQRPQPQLQRASNKG